MNNRIRLNPVYRENVEQAQERLALAERKLKIEKLRMAANNKRIMSEETIRRKVERESRVPGKTIHPKKPV